MRKKALLQLLFLAALLATALFSLFSVSTERFTTAAAIRPVYGLIRFHILANSDAPEDQQLKHQVRQAVVAYLAPKIEEATTYEEAHAIILRERASVAAVARQVVADAGADYPVTVEVGRFDFPIKTYGSLTLPSGNYEALRIFIGRGEGHNWWCVLFPPLCFIDVTTSTAVPTGTSPADNPQLKWKFIEILQRQEKVE